MSFYNNIRRIALLAALALCCGSAWAAKTLYLNTGGSSLWGTSSPDFYVHAFHGTTSSDSDTKMTLVEGNIYSVTVNDDYKSIIFVRHNPSCSSFSWSCKWNQTADLTIPTDGTNCYKITGWDAVGTWTTYTPTIPSYSVSVTNGTASSASVLAGGSVTLTANTIDCKQFTGWTLSGATVSDLTVTPLTISNVQANITATANYSAITVPSSISIGLSAESITQMQSVTVTPTPSPSVYAVRVVGKVSGCSTEITSEEKTVTVTALPGTTIHVKFPSAWFNSYSTPAIWYWKTGGNGTPAAMTYEFDDADGGKWYYFEIPYGKDNFLLKTKVDDSTWSWQSKNVTTPSAETCYSVVTTTDKAATVIDCVTPPVYYTVSVTNGSASSASVLAGSSVTLTANDASDCQQFTGWTLSGATVSDLTVTPLTISNVQDNITATANYSAIALPSSISIALSATSITQTQSVTVTPTPSPSVSGITPCAWSARCRAVAPKSLPKKKR